MVNVITKRAACLQRIRNLKSLPENKTSIAKNHSGVWLQTGIGVGFIAQSECCLEGNRDIKPYDNLHEDRMLWI